MNFQILDWIVLTLYLVFTVYVGIRAKKYVENADGYFVAGRRVRLALGSATLIATEIGIVTFMYLGELGYVTGFSCFFLGLVGLIGYTVIGRTGFIVQALRRLRVITIPEFYELRYNKRVRILGGIILFFGGVLNMGIFLKFDAIFLTETIGLGPDLLLTVMIVMMLVVVSYTVLGGMFSVVITDFAQFVVLSLGMLVATISILTHVGLGDIAAAVEIRFGEAGVNPVINERFGWSFILWMLIASIATSALWQPAASKSLASDSPQTGRKVFLFTGLTLAGRYMIPMFWGVAALALLGPKLDSGSAMPRLLGSVVPTGFLGLMVAGMLAASMSTYSAYMLAWSSVATRDVMTPLSRNGIPERTLLILTKCIAVLIGIFLVVFGLFYEIPATAFQYIALTGAMYSAGAFGCVAAGLYWKKANTVGAYASLLLGAVAPLAFLLLERSKESLPPWLRFVADVNVSGFLSFLLAALGMVVGSLITQGSHPPAVLHQQGEEK
ncbi:MAG: sodium:solute symporter family protein [Ignavibacteriales bacterium]|nr:sodium:solute symporter family protein [Ignavibacteriales bacterium]